MLPLKIKKTVQSIMNIDGFFQFALGYTDAGTTPIKDLKIYNIEYPSA